MPHLLVLFQIFDFECVFFIVFIYMLLSNDRLSALCEIIIGLKVLENIFLTVLMHV